MNKRIEVIIIANNEEDVIENAIKSVKGWAANIIVIDAESIDGTVNIAKKFRAKVITHKFKDFSDQRNFAANQSDREWIFYMDADERATEAFKKEVDLRLEENFYDAFEIKRDTYFFGKRWGFKDKVLRIIRVEKFRKWEGVVHETAHVDGRIGIINSPVKHFTHRSLSQMVEKTNKWSDYEASLRFEAGHPKMKWWRFVRVMTSEFLRSYFKQNGYRNGTYGFVEAVYQSYSIFITYAKLWELQNKKN